MATAVQRSWKGYRIGRDHHNAKVNEISVRNMRRRHEEDRVGYGTLGKEYGLGISTVRDICGYRTWIHVR